MRNNGLVFLGLALVALGLMSIIGIVFGINLWSLCWPAALIAAGVWMLARPRLHFGGENVTIRPLADIKRFGAWQVRPEEIWIFVGDVELDLARAEIPQGITTLRIFGFVGDIDLFVPREVGLTVVSNAFISDARLDENKRESFLLPVELSTPNDPAAAQRVRVETFFFISEIKARQV